MAFAVASIDASQVPQHHAPAAGDAQLAAGQGSQLLAAAAIPLAAEGSALSPTAVRQSAFFKRLHYRLTAPIARESLVAQALAASTTDHPEVSCD